MAIPAADMSCESHIPSSGSYVRTHSDLTRVLLPPGEALEWRGDPASFESMLLRFTFADGSERLVDVDAQMAARNWTIGPQFVVPVPQSEYSLIGIDMVVERPQSLQTFRDQMLVSRADGARLHFLGASFAALILGILLVPIFYDTLFYRVLRPDFMRWHIAMSIAMAVFVLSNSGLIFEALPNLPLRMRWLLNSLSFTTAIVCAVLFAIHILEDEMVDARSRHLLTGLMLMPIGLMILQLADFEPLRLRLQQVFLVSFAPLAAVLLMTLCRALHRGSRAALFVLLAFSGAIIASVVAVLEGLEIIHLGRNFGTLLALALIVLSLGTSAAVGDRFMVLRAQRDKARQKAAQFGAMAHTDGLTGLSNRRAFDVLRILEPGQGLIVLDIDRFKAINDSFGHQQGDIVLCRVARILRETFGARPDAMAYRLGGEEFACVLPSHSEKDLLGCAETLRDQVAAIGDDECPGVTISAGVVLGEGQPLAVAYSAADAAMYRAKARGRNCAVAASDCTAPPSHVARVAHDLADPGKG